MEVLTLLLNLSHRPVHSASFPPSSRVRRQRQDCWERLWGSRPTSRKTSTDQYVRLQLLRGGGGCRYNDWKHQQREIQWRHQDQSIDWQHQRRSWGHTLQLRFLSTQDKPSAFQDADIDKDPSWRSLHSFADDQRRHRSNSSQKVRLCEMILFLYI